jgi:hypothetical protein
MKAFFNKHRFGIITVLLYFNSFLFFANLKLDGPLWLAMNFTVMIMLSICLYREFD